MMAIPEKKENGIKIVVSIAGAVIAFLFCGVLLLLFNIDPLETYTAIFTKALGSESGIAQTLVSASPILLAAIGIELAGRAGIVNLGAEGQMIAGAVGAQLVIMGCGNLPMFPAIVLTLAGGMLFGALWTLVPSVLKVNFGVNEIVVLIMTNQIASYLLGWLVRDPLKDPKSSNNQGALIPENVWIPRLDINTKIHIGIFLTAIVLFVYWILKRTILGFRIQVVGESERSAVYAGISRGKIMFGTFLASGALAGLAGALQVTGVHHRLTGSISGGFGWTGIMVAMIAGSNPVALALVAILYSALSVGNLIIQVTSKVPTQLADIIQAIVVLFVIGAQSIYEMFKKRRRA